MSSTPEKRWDSERVRKKESWWSSTRQIFSGDQFRSVVTEVRFADTTDRSISHVLFWSVAVEFQRIATRIYF
ncbi:unnamed protein product [Anisakis simplex]|uniref:Uncharacterized protein n=1 Tax=Anisakis simplex TaxID=6269 RepID=A0A0M3K459_ANISI|nr:unnamed protein product [Anisakis simplex]